MRERGIGFNQAVNEALRQGPGAQRDTTPFVTPTHHLGQSRLPRDQALRVAGHLEDAELVRQSGLGE